MPRKAVASFVAAAEPQGNITESWGPFARRQGREPSAPDPRITSFVRLNSFLLRTHVTSLVAALAEDGWLETWEKDKLCMQSRDASSPWSVAFLKTYSRFVETEDLHAFLAGLRSLLC